MPGYEKNRFINLKDEDELMCGICHGIFINPKVTPCCRQTYCGDCIEQWLEVNSSCPNDRQPLYANNLFPAPRIIFNLLNKLVMNCEFYKNGCEENFVQENINVHMKMCAYNPNNICNDCDHLIGNRSQHNCLQNLKSDKIKLNEDKKEVEHKLHLSQIALNSMIEKRMKYLKDFNHLKEKDTNINANHVHFIFQNFMDFDPKIAKNIILKYKNLIEENYTNDNEYDNKFSKLTKLEFGLHFGTFLKESGWYALSKDILKTAIQLYDELEMICDHKILNLVFECNLNLLSVLNAFCCLAEANALMNKIQTMIDFYDMKSRSNEFNLAQVYTEFAQLFFLQNNYNESYKWAIESLQQINEFTSTLTIIDVYRQAAKTCVVKSEFKKAETLINQAMIICKETFKMSENQNKYTIEVFDLKLAEVFEDYAFYLLNTDSISHSVMSYEMSLKIRENIFGLDNNNVNNLLIAKTFEDLGYATYVRNYSSGNFLKADNYATKALKIKTQLLPEKHLLLASVKRVKALIIEEIALDLNRNDAQKMLLKAEELHLSAINITQQAFGEMNVQTAKHYGNLGRLYQSLKLYKKAENMHLKAIKIKEQLLGPNNYDLALSLGHLASLYNYDMEMCEKAEELYLRSIDIEIKAFGVGHSGLEYDYRGLCRVYSKLDNKEKLFTYKNKLDNWQKLREGIIKSETNTNLIKGLEIKDKLSSQEIISLIEKF